MWDNRYFDYHLCTEAQINCFSLLCRATLHYGVYDYGPEQVREYEFKFNRRANTNDIFPFEGEINA